MILLDTHVLLWSRLGDGRIGHGCRQEIDQALRKTNLAVSAFSFWEVTMLQEKGRINLLRDIGSWRMALMEDGLIEIPVDGEIAIRANRLENFHVDPADRIIVATALGGHTLVTADERILGWEGSLARLDAKN